jgi:hypothetical protein
MPFTLTDEQLGDMDAEEMIEPIAKPVSIANVKLATG